VCFLSFPFQRLWIKTQLKLKSNKEKHKVKQSEGQNSVFFLLVIDRKKEGVKR
jgi:hypothetical protein